MISQNTENAIPRSKISQGIRHRSDVFLRPGDIVSRQKHQVWALPVSQCDHSVNGVERDVLTMVDVRQVSHAEPIKRRWEIPQRNRMSRHFNLTVREKTRGLKISGEERKAKRTGRLE